MCGICKSASHISMQCYLLSKHTICLPSSSLSIMSNEMNEHKILISTGCVHFVRLYSNSGNNHGSLVNQRSNLKNSEKSPLPISKAVHWLSSISQNQIQPLPSPYTASVIVHRSILNHQLRSVGWLPK